MSMQTLREYNQETTEKVCNFIWNFLILLPRILFSLLQIYIIITFALLLDNTIIYQLNKYYI